jgi:hypothetical protein
MPARSLSSRRCSARKQSASLHVGNRTVPQQLLVHSPKGGNKPTPLPHNTSLFDVRYTLPDDKHVSVLGGLRLFSLPAALVGCGPGFFRQNPTDARAALAMIRDASDVLAVRVIVLARASQALGVIQLSCTRNLLLAARSS